MAKRSYNDTYPEVNHTDKNKLKLLADIYMTYCKLGLVGFGGGFSIIPLIERKVVEDKKWVEKEKMIDIMSVASSLPGATALNSSAFAGYAVAGVPGAVCALLGNMTPSVVIVLSLSILFLHFSALSAVKSAFTGIYPVIVAMIAYAAFSFGKTAIRDVPGIVLAVLALSCSLFFDVGPVPLLVFGALAGIAVQSGRSLISLRKSGKTGTFADRSKK